jgi:RNA-directed DNA polymerase
MSKLWLYPMTPSVSSGLTSVQMHEKGKQFEMLTDEISFARLIKSDVKTLKKWADKPQYSQFEIPKPGGAKRLIQSPVAELKDLQQRMNLYLQCFYHYLKPPCAYGFILNATDELRIRNIYTNASQHLTAQWVLNMDIKEFFPSINSQMLHNTLKELLGFTKPLIQLVGGLCTCRGKLPTGSPTSPILSNLVCLDLDMKLQSIARAYDAVYTRYADDLTFSFSVKPSEEALAAIRQIIEHQGFIVNDAKTKLLPMGQKPEVTGLILKPTKPDVSLEFIKDLKREIKIWQWMMREENIMRGLINDKVLEKLHRSIMGQIQFVAFVRGRDDRKYLRLVAAMQQI